MYLCRIKNPEQLRNIGNQQKSSKWNTEPAKKWSSGKQNEFYYIDGNIQVYHGHQPHLGKNMCPAKCVACQGVQTSWVNNAIGMPYFFVYGQVNENLQ